MQFIFDPILSLWHGRNQTTNEGCLQEQSNSIEIAKTCHVLNLFEQQEISKRTKLACTKLCRVRGNELNAGLLIRKMDIWNSRHPWLY